MDSITQQNRYISELVNKATGLVIDTNLLILLFIGLFDSTEIDKFKKTKKYSIEDFENVKSIATFFSKKGCLYINQSILTELTNLSDSFNNQNRHLFFEFIKNQFNNFKEHSEPAIEIMNTSNKVYIKLGFTDASIYCSAKEKILILTDDLELYQFLSNSNYLVLNYNHLRN